jgi:enoyl-CoA hydratase
MTVSIEKSGPVWTVIHNRPEARNAMDPSSADALTQAFLAFDADDEARVAVFYGEGGAFCAGWDLKYVSTLDQGYPLGELDIPPAGRAATAARFPVVRWVRRGSSSISPSLQPWPAPPWPAGWSLRCGVISG